MAFTWSTLWLACLSLALAALARSATDASAGADSHARSAEPPRVRVEPERQVVRPGDSPSFHCRVESDHPYDLHWEAVGRGHASSANTSDDHVTLQFHNIPVADQGRYICLAINRYGEAQAAVEVVVEEFTTTTAPMTTHETPAVDLGALLDAGEGAVVTLVAGDTRLAAHRAVLTARSPVFKAMLSGNTPEASSGQLDIADVEGPVLRQLLAYMYTLQVPQASGMAPQLLAAADSYGVSGLKAACERQLVAQLSVDNAATSAALAVRHSCPRLKEAAVAFIRANLLAVMVTQGWTREILSHPKDMTVVTQLVAQLPAGTSPPPAAEGGSTPGPQPHAGSSQTTAASEPATAAGSTSTPGGGAVSSQSTPPAAEGGSTPGPHPHTGSSQTTAASAPATAAGSTSTPGGGAVSSQSPPPAAEGGSTPGPQPHAGSSQTTAASTPATAAGSTSTPGGGAVSSQSRTPDSCTPAPPACTPAPPTCNACRPDCDAACGRYRSLPAEEKGRRLIEAAKEGAVREVAALLAAGADLEARDWDRRTALYWAARNGHVEAVRRLLSCGAEVDARSSKQWTPLHSAAFNGQAAAARLLLVAGADVNARNEIRFTPLHLAAQEGHTALVRLLVAAGADVNARDDNRWTPLHAAARHGHAAAVRPLAAAGADVNTRDDNRWTPLHSAAYRGHAKAAAALLRAGADRGATTIRGNTPLALAKQQKHKAVVDLLTRS